MNIKHIKNGSLYKEKKSNKVWRVRSKANTSSVWVTHHSNKPELVKASDLVEAITSSKGPLDAWLTNGVYKNLLQLKTGVQYGKTVLSPETQVRNFYSAMMFPLARGVLGGRASATDAIAMVADDIFNFGIKGGI